MITYKSILQKRFTLLSHYFIERLYALRLLEKHLAKESPFLVMVFIIRAFLIILWNYKLCDPIAFKERRWREGFVGSSLS